MSVTISQLPPATTLTGDELVPVVQNDVTVRTTAQDIADLASGGGIIPPANLGSGSATSHTLLHGNSTWSAVSLSADVSGDLPIANLNSGSGASSSTFWRGDGTWASAGGGAVTGSWSADFTGFITVPTTATVNYVIANGLCTLYLTTDVIDSGDGSDHLSITNLPGPVTPSNNVAAACNVLNNNVAVPGAANVSTAGVIEFSTLLLLAIPPASPDDLTLEVAGFNTDNVGLSAGWSVTYPL